MVSRRTAASGLTLIELMVVVALIAVILGLVAPSFKRLIETQRVLGVNSQLVTDLQWARSEAVTRNARVRLTVLQNSTLSCYTIYTYSDNDAMCDCRLTPSCTAADQTELRTVRIPRDTAVRVASLEVNALGTPVLQFAFEPIAGQLYTIPNDFDPTPLSQFRMRTFIDTSRTLYTIVGMSGRPTVCRPAGSTLQASPCP